MGKIPHLVSGLSLGIVVVIMATASAVGSSLDPFGGIIGMIILLNLLIAVVSYLEEDTSSEVK